MSYRPPPLDVQPVAELCSQLSGVLAGFALTAVFIVVAHFLGDELPFRVRQLRQSFISSAPSRTPGETAPLRAPCTQAIQKKTAVIRLSSIVLPQ